MEIYTTLTQFIEEQLTKFQITNTEKNQNKLRIKFTRTLKDLNLWDNAETRLIGRKHTKVFTHRQLQMLYSKVEPYLLKLSSINKEDLKAYRKDLKEHIEKVQEWDEEKEKQEIQESYYSPPVVTRNEAIEVMITALFEKHFEPLDIKKWNDDKALIYFTDIMDMDDISAYQANRRLDNPVSSYVKPLK